MFIKDNKRFNIFAPASINGVLYPNFMNGKLREKLGITEVSEPTPPEDFSVETYYVHQLDEAPFTLYTRKSDEQIAKLVQSKINQESLAYLASTDWMVTRFAETGVEIPVEVKEKRQAARDAIVLIDIE